MLTAGLNRAQLAFGRLANVGKRFSHELSPRFKLVAKKHKGRIPVRTGASSKGSTVAFGDYGLRLKSAGLRMSAKQLKEADAVVMRVMRAHGGKLWRRLCTNIAVCTKGNETRMGKGKGPFDYWAVRVPTGKVIFECGGENLHEKVAKDAFRRAGEKLPGVFEFVKKGDPARVGLKSLKEAEEKVNYKELRKENPSRRDAVLQKSKRDEYSVYNGRSK